MNSVLEQRPIQVKDDQEIMPNKKIGQGQMDIVSKNEMSR